MLGGGARARAWECIYCCRLCHFCFSQWINYRRLGRRQTEKRNECTVCFTWCTWYNRKSIPKTYRTYDSFHWIAFDRCCFSMQSRLSFVVSRFFSLLFVRFIVVVVILFSVRFTLRMPRSGKHLVCVVRWNLITMERNRASCYCTKCCCHHD